VVKTKIQTHRFRNTIILMNSIINDDPDELDDAGEEIEQFEHYRFIADPGQGLLRIDKFSGQPDRRNFPNRIQIAAEAGSIFVNDVAVKSNYRVKPNDEVTIMLDYPRRELKLVPEKYSAQYCL